MNEKAKDTKVFSNLIWRFGQVFGSNMVSLIVSIVLGRILDPEVYGTVAIVTVITTILQVFVDSGMATALIQKKDSDTYVPSEPDFMPATLCAEVVFHHEYSAGGSRRGRNRRITFRNINVYGDKLPRVKFKGYDETHKTEHITIENLRLNGTLLSSLPPDRWQLGDFTEDIVLKTTK